MNQPTKPQSVEVQALGHSKSSSRAERGLDLCGEDFRVVAREEIDGTSCRAGANCGCLGIPEHSMYH